MKETQKIVLPWTRQKIIQHFIFTGELDTYDAHPVTIDKNNNYLMATT